CLDRLRRRAARPTVPLADAGDSSDPRPVGGVEPVAPAVDHDTVLTVRAALQQLPDEQRVAIVLVDLQGYPVAEVAAMLGVAEGTVKSRCARGRARLAALLGHLPEQSPSGTGPRSAPAGNRNADGTVPFRSGGTTPKGGARCRSTGISSPITSVGRSTAPPSTPGSPDSSPLILNGQRRPPH